MQLKNEQKRKWLNVIVFKLNGLNAKTKRENWRKSSKSVPVPIGMANPESRRKLPSLPPPTLNNRIRSYEQTRV